MSNHEIHSMTIRSDHRLRHTGSNRPFQTVNYRHERRPSRLALKRGHWLIENRLHWRKDVTFGEDASLIHTGQGPAVMSHLRNAASSLLHHHGVQQVAARLRALS